MLHLRSLTGLRFVAAFTVFFSHIQHVTFPESRNLPVGGPAVSFFFVLSGFILTYVYHNRLTWRGVPRFFATRIARLWPLHLVCLGIALLFLASPPATDPSQGNSWFSLGAQTLMLQSWLPIHNWYMDFNSVSWSISTEMFFYFAFPVLLLAGSRRYFGWKVGLSLALAFACLFATRYLLNSDAQPAWFTGNGIGVAFPLTRLFEFVVGMATCLWMLGRKTPMAAGPSGDRNRFLADTLWEGIAVLLILMAWGVVYRYRVAHHVMQLPFSGPIIAHWFRITSGAVFYAFALYTFSRCRGLTGCIMASRPAVWLGEISYAFYLIHQIVIVQLNLHTLGDAGFIAFSFLIALFASAILYRVVEMPCRDALVRCYDRKPGSLACLVGGLKGCLVSRTGRLQTGGLLLVLTLLWMQPQRATNQRVCQQIMDATPAHLRNVRFHQEALLMGFEAERVERGVRLRMAWVPERTMTRNRFLHICDADGKIIGQGPFEKRLFRKARPHEPFVDELVLKKRTLRDAAYVAVGFWSKSLSCAVVHHPQADMGGFRLIVVDLRQLE